MIEAEHLCVSSRGVEDTGSSTVTSKLGGGFKSDVAARNEFYQIARQGSSK
jgi:GTP cyclohydrolase I